MIIDTQNQKNESKENKSQIERSGIRFINYNDLIVRKKFPRYPNDKDITIFMEEIDLENSLLIFFSHCWLRGWHGAEGWDGKPHPDNKNHDKYKLLMEAVSKLRGGHSQGLKNTYLWIDFACIDQDGDPAAELRQLDTIIYHCDMILTVIVDDDHKSWSIGNSAEDSYLMYKSKLWTEQGSNKAYLNRAWCRVEMLYAATIPLEEYQFSEERLKKIDSGLKTAMLNGNRVHMLYGSKESFDDLFPIILPPLKYSNLKSFNPAAGFLSVENDRSKIEFLMDDLKKYERSLSLGYSGKVNEKGVRSGLGRFIFDDGSIYEGSWKNNLPDGQGLFKWPNGDFYSGQFVAGKRDGVGISSSSYGGVFDGHYLKDKKHGPGTIFCSTGPIIEGNYIDDIRTGPGKIIMPGNFCIFDGNFSNDLPLLRPACKCNGCAFFICLCWKNCDCCNCICPQDHSVEAQQEKYNWKYLKDKLIDAVILKDEAASTTQTSMTLPKLPNFHETIKPDVDIIRIEERLVDTTEESII